MTMPATANRQAITVLGMHRSGTSALAGALGMLGARLPARLVAAAPQNPKGFFEPSRIVEIHDRLLASRGSKWFSFARIPQEWFLSAEADAFADEIAAAVREDYGDAALFVVKDPRLCRLVPLWQKVLAKVGAEGRFAIPLRHPIEVAQSLAERDAVPLGYGCALWLRHVLEAERDTRGARRVFIHYHDLLQRPARTAEYVASQLAESWRTADGARARELTSFIDPAMRHYVAKAEDLQGASDFRRWIKEALEAASALVHDSADAKAQHRLDEIRTQFDSVTASLAPLVEANELLIDLRAQFKHQSAHLERVTEGRDHFQAELGRMIDSRNHFQAEYGHAAEVEATLRAELRRTAQARDFLFAELDRMTASRDEFQAGVARMEEARNHYQAELGRMTESRDYFQAELVRLTEAPAPSEAARGRSNGALWPGLRRFLTRLWARDPVR